MAVKKAIKAIAKTLFANPKNYGGKRSLSSIKYIVIHLPQTMGIMMSRMQTTFATMWLRHRLIILLTMTPTPSRCRLKTLHGLLVVRSTRTVPRRAVVSITKSAPIQTPSTLNCVIRLRMERFTRRRQRSTMRLHLLVS